MRDRAYEENAADFRIIFDSFVVVHFYFAFSEIRQCCRHKRISFDL